MTLFFNLPFSRCFIVFSFLIFTSSTIVAQTEKTATIKGIILDGEEEGEPLIGGNVILNNGDGAATDFNGAYNFKTTPGSYTITFKYIGYQSQNQKVELTEGETKVINIT